MSPFNTVVPSRSRSPSNSKGSIVIFVEGQIHQSWHQIHRLTHWAGTKGKVNFLILGYLTTWASIPSGISITGHHHPYWASREGDFSYIESPYPLILHSMGHHPIGHLSSRDILIITGHQGKVIFLILSHLTPWSSIPLGIIVLIPLGIIVIRKSSC